MTAPAELPIFIPHFSSVKAKSLERTIEDYIESSSIQSDWPEFKEALYIVTRNTRGKLYLTGSSIYKPPISHLYRTHLLTPPFDLDFLIEEHPKDDLYLPKGWKQNNTRHGNVSLSKGVVRLDISFMYEYQIMYEKLLGRKLPNFNIETFLKLNPLNIGSMAYDFLVQDPKDLQAEGHLIGEQGIEAIRNRVVKINNSKAAKALAEIEGISVEELVRRKAFELGFKFFYIESLHDSQTNIP